MAFMNFNILKARVLLLEIEKGINPLVLLTNDIRKEEAGKMFH